MVFDALIVGAGPGGSTVAQLLAQAGWSVLLADKAVFPRRKVCGEFVSATNLSLLRALGLSQAVSGLAGPPVTQIALYCAELMVCARPIKAWGQALGREHLDLLLRDAAVENGARLLQPAELIGWRRTPSSHICTFKTAQGVCEIAAKTVVAACGSWSGKNPFAPGVLHPSPFDMFAFKGSFQGSCLSQGVMPLLAFPGGYGGMVQSDHGKTSFSCCIRRDRLSQVRRSHSGRAGEAVLAHILATTKGVALALVDARLEGAMLCVGPIRPGVRQAYKDGVFRVGNVAGEAHPIIAEGISMAMQSSALLARLLIAKGASEETGLIYARLWNRNFARRIRAAALFSTLAIHDRRRALAQGIVAHFPQLLNWGAQISGKALRPFPIESFLI